MNYLAIDLGAESGRVILGSIDLNAVDRPHVSLKELQRFPNTPTRAGASLHWNIQKLWDSVAAGVTAIENDFIDGISVDDDRSSQGQGTSLAGQSFDAPVQPLAVMSKATPSGSWYLTS